MKLADLVRDTYLCPTTPVTCRFEGLRFITDEPLRQFCGFSDGNLVVELVLAAGASLSPGLRIGEMVDATVGIRTGRRMARVEVFAIKRAIAKVSVVPAPTHQNPHGGRRAFI